MLQAALGGYTLVTEDIIQHTDDLTFYEPGYNLMAPLELSVSKADSIYILIRKRDSEGFENDLVYTDLSIIAKDATNGEILTVKASNSNYGPWNHNPSSNTPILLEIESQLDMLSPILRVRVIDCEVKDLTDNSFINFRIIVEEDSTELYFHYIPVFRKIYSDRNTFSIANREAYVTLRNDSDTYILVSPYAWLKETEKNVSDFSYPLDTFYYQREDTYNNEDFTFSLQNGSGSYSWVEDNVSVLNIPGYKKTALILIDNAIYTEIQKLKRSVNFIMSVSGDLSGIEDTFTINLYT